MLTFFRRIRKGLLGSGKTQKYILNALGEIALVVIGILIALQINNWNEWRKGRELEEYYLHQLRQELEYNLDMADNGIQRQVRNHTDASLLLAVIEGDTIISDSKVLAFAIERTGFYYRVDYINNIWNELNSTGHIALIRDNELRRELVDMQRGFDRTQYFNDQFNTFNEGFRRIAGDIIKSSLRPKLVLKMDNGESREKIDGLANPQYITNALRERDEMNSYLADIIMTRRAGLDNYNDDKEKMKQIFELIEGQLK